jgi:long-chain acyl-CoA synthetase
VSFNLATMLHESRLASPDKACVVIDETTLTYAQVDQMAGLVAGNLLASGLQPGDKVAVQLPNVPHFLFAYFAILRAGLVMVPLNPLLREGEVAYHLENSDAATLVTFDLVAAEAHQAAQRVGQRVGHHVGGLPTYVVELTGAGRPEGTVSFDELLAPVQIPDITPTGSDDTAVILYTSGTTGKPKGAELTHFQLYMNCTIGGDLLGFEDDDIGIAVLPFFHVFGLSSVLNATIRYGGTTVLVPRFDVDLVVDAIEKHRATIFPGVPTMFTALLQAAREGRDLSSLRVGISGGAAIPGEVIRAFEEHVPGCVVLEGYGLSETASTTTFNVSAEERKVLSIGKPVWGVQVRVVDVDDQPLPPGPEHIGEIVVRGHNVLKSYYKNPEATAEAMRGGWFHTGDLAYADEDGYLFIVDRKKDLVIRGGYNVYPREIEEVLYEHPAVAEAAVIGKPDDRLGEEVVAVVGLRPGAEASTEELIAFCKERMAAYKYPREVRIVPELPKGPTGKILKKELR